MKHFVLPVGLLLLVACQQNQTPSSTNEEKMNYPQTRKDSTVDTYFGTQVADPYRWLEDDRSAETAAWVKAQNAFTFDYLSKIPYRQTIKEKLEKLWNYEKIGSPFVEGDYTYYYKNDGLQNQSVLYRKDKDGKEEVFLNPNTFSADGTTSLATVAFTEDGSLVAYLISEGGSDWRKGIVLDAKTKKQIGETLVDIKFSGIAWKATKVFTTQAMTNPKVVSYRLRLTNTNCTTINSALRKVKMYWYLAVLLLKNTAMYRAVCRTMALTSSFRLPMRLRATSYL